MGSAMEIQVRGKIQQGMDKRMDWIKDRNRSSMESESGLRYKVTSQIDNKNDGGVNCK